MAHTLIAALLSIGLLASGDACAWLCGAADPGTRVETHSDISSHCAGGATSADPVPEETPTHEDCPGCALDVAASSAFPQALSAHSTPVLALAPGAHLAGPEVPSFRSGLSPPRMDRSPPRDVLALTTTLLL